MHRTLLVVHHIHAAHDGEGWLAMIMDIETRSCAARTPRSCEGAAPPSSSDDRPAGQPRAGGFDRSPLWRNGRGRVSSPQPAKAKAPSPHLREDSGPSKKIRQRPTLPRGFPRSTIGSGGLNFRVRDGNGWDPSDIATGNWCDLYIQRVEFQFLLEVPSFGPAPLFWGVCTGPRPWTRILTSHQVCW